MSQESKHKGRSFNDEFSRDAVNLIVKQGYSFRAAADAVGPFERGPAFEVVLEVMVGVPGDLGVGSGERVDRVGEHPLIGFGADSVFQAMGEPA